MGGFTLNGMGWGDSFYPKLGLGCHYCIHCKSMEEFVLCEVKTKIKVFFIPTVSIKTSYAVTCAKCKEGYYISDEQRDALLYQGAGIKVDEKTGVITIKMQE